MLASIVTPSFNQSRFIEDTIRSVLSQDYPQIEHLIVDGTSTDGTVDIIRRYEHQLAWWVSERDQGQTDAINKGISRATGGILAWLNSDDTYEPGAVLAAVKVLWGNPAVGMVYGDCHYIDQDGEWIGQFKSRQTSSQRIRRGYNHIPEQKKI